MQVFFCYSSYFDRIRPWTDYFIFEGGGGGRERSGKGGWTTIAKKKIIRAQEKPKKNVLPHQIPREKRYRSRRKKFLLKKTGEK